MRTDRVERSVQLARGSVAVERLWPALWPALGLLGLWLTAGLFGAFALIPAWLHLVALIGFLCAQAWLLTLQLRGFAFPGWNDGARRLETDSGFAHRPISEGADGLAAGQGDAYAEALWRAHLRALLARIGRLSVRWPHPPMAERDPYALRFAVLLLLLAGFFVAGRSWPQRLAAAFVPDFTSSGGATLDAWIDPPAYTGAAPIYLSNRSEALAVPSGSKLVLHVHGAGGLPRLDLDAGREHFAPFAPAGAEGEYAADATLTRSGRLSVLAAGRALGRWQVRIVPDLPPTVRFAAPPSGTERNATKFVIAGSDDYGIVKLRVTMTPVRGVRRTPLTVELPVDNSHAKRLDETAYQDLTANPYAGAAVRATVTATDGAGQSATSAPVIFTLPQRLFTDPLARALVEQRRNLVLDDVTALPLVQEALDALTIEPERFMPDKPGPYTAMRSAYWALKNARERADITRVENLLWQTALALDQHGAAILSEQLRRLQALLTQALEQGAPPEVIEQLLQRYAQVMQQYLEAMAQNAQGAGEPPPPGGKSLGQQDLTDMLKAIQQLAETGARGQAAQMLALLQNLLENLKIEPGGSGGGGEASAQDKAAGEAVRKLGDLMGRQRELLDKTYRQSQGNGDAADGGGKGLSDKQGQLKTDLGQALDTLKRNGVKLPPSLGQAGRDMGQAQGDLAQKDFGTATEAQKQALEDMRKGVGDLADQLAKNGQGKNGAGSDPLGRPQGAVGAISGGGVKIPDKSTLERAREILQELRKRAGERGRSQEELDYIERLLKQF